MDIYSRKIGGVKYDDITVYTRAEADDHGIKYVHWREAQVGDWAVTDDDYVGYCYARYDFPQRSSGAPTSRVRFVHYFGFGNLMSSRKDPYLYERRRANNRFESDKSWNEALASRRISKMCAKIYVHSLLNTGKIDWAALGRILGPNDEKPEWKARRIFKTKEFKTMVEDELEKALTAKGINKEKVLSFYLEAIELAKANGDPATMLKGAKDLGDIVGLAPTKVKKVETWEMENNQAQITEGFAKAEQSIKRITRTTEGTDETETVRITDGRPAQDGI